MTKRVLLTGASGFVGSHILKHILANTDWEVVCLTTFTHQGNQDRIVFATEDLDPTMSRVKVLICDLSSPISSITSSKIGKIDYVINAASESHVDRSVDSPAPFIINNVSLVCNLLDWARTANLEKFIQISTDEVYGPYQNRKSIEWDAHLPSNPYSASKAAQESIAFAYWRTYNIPIIITNTMNIIGEAQGTEKFTPLLIKKLINNEAVDIHTYDNGKIGSRYWLYVGNKASAIIHILKNVDALLPNNSDKPERFNIAGDEQYTNLQWAEMISEILGTGLRYNLKDSSISRPGYDPHYALDNSKLLATGWTAPYDLRQSLDKTVMWYLNNQEWL
jgi:dTDP-glucose 4,6-dehydratase